MSRLLILLLLLFSGAVGAEEPRTLTFGIVPQQAASKLARLWGPLLVHAGERCGYRLRFMTAPDIPEFERRLASGEYDLAYMNPYHFTVFNEHPGYRALVKARDKHIQGIVVVAKESPIEEIHELHGKTLAFPSPAAFAASILLRSEFRRLGIDITPKYVASHDSVYRAVAQGLLPAGGGVMRTLNGVDPAVRDQLRILHRSDEYTPHAIAAHPRISTETAEAVATALVNMDSEADGRLLLSALGLKGWEQARDADWDDVRALNIKLLDELIR